MQSGGKDSRSNCADIPDPISGFYFILQGFPALKNVYQTF